MKVRILILNDFRRISKLGKRMLMTGTPTITLWRVDKVAGVPLQAAQGRWQGSPGPMTQTPHSQWPRGPQSWSHAPFLMMRFALARRREKWNHLD